MKARTRYTKAHIAAASATVPMPEARRAVQLLKMWQGLSALEHADVPETNDWRVCSDAVNLLETLVDMGEVEDRSGLIDDAVRELAECGKRHLKGRPLRLTGSGIQTIRAVLEDYAACLGGLPERTIIRAHRETERRIQSILRGNARPHDVEVVDL